MAVLRFRLFTTPANADEPVRGCNAAGEAYFRESSLTGLAATSGNGDPEPTAEGSLRPSYTKRATESDGWRTLQRQLFLIGCRRCHRRRRAQFVGCRALAARRC